MDGCYNTWLGRRLSIGILMYWMRCLHLSWLEDKIKKISLTNSYSSWPIRVNLAKLFVSYVGKRKTNEYSIYPSQFPLCGHTDKAFGKAALQNPLHPFQKHCCSYRTKPSLRRLGIRREGDYCSIP